MSKKYIPEVKCVQGFCLWRNTSAEVNEEIFKGSWRGNPERMTNEIAAGFFFLLKSFLFVYISYLYLDC